VDTFIFLITFISFFWVISFVPYNIMVMLRSVIHDRGYTYSIYDTISGITIGILLLYGSPFLTGLHELKSFIGY